MADDPIVALDGQTPLQYAVTPGFDFLAKHGVNGTLCTVPGGFRPGVRLPILVSSDMMSTRCMKDVARLKQPVWE